MLIRFDESEVVSIVGATGVYEYTVKLVFPGFGPVGRLIEELVKVNFKGKLKAIVDLRGGIKVVPITLQRCK